MRISDWSSDVFSSDLLMHTPDDTYQVRPGALEKFYDLQDTAVPDCGNTSESFKGLIDADKFIPSAGGMLKPGTGNSFQAYIVDRKRAVKGKCVSERVDSGGRRIIKKKKENKNE